MVKTNELLNTKYGLQKQKSAAEESRGFALEIRATDREGLMAEIASIVSSCGGNLVYSQSWKDLGTEAKILIQVNREDIKDQVIDNIRHVGGVSLVKQQGTSLRTFGKRVIILGGGAQVAQVAAGAIAEADRHNIRGETISVDTIAVVGEEQIAAAVRGVGPLHRAAILVLAGALMGGDIKNAVEELRLEYGIPVISLKMAGSINKHTDLVVTDPLEAGVLAVMCISHIAKCDLNKLRGRTI
jgi:energy-converting hydrogenase B subunit Q